MRKIKLFIATPMYGGQCYGLYTKSLMDTTNAWLTEWYATRDILSI